MEQFNNLEQQEALNKTRATDKVLDTTHLTNKDPYTITHDAVPLSSCCFRWLLPAAAAGVVEMVAAAAAAAEMASVAAQMDAAAAVVRILLGSLAKDFWMHLESQPNHCFFNAGNFTINNIFWRLAIKSGAGAAARAATPAAPTSSERRLSQAS